MKHILQGNKEHSQFFSESYKEDNKETRGGGTGREGNKESRACQANVETSQDS